MKKCKVPVTCYIFPVIILGFLALYHIDDIIPMNPKSTGPPPVVILESFNNKVTVSKQCSPKKNIVFIKTHKTAGSSVQNVLLRYADKNELTVALPILSNSHVFQSSRTFAKDMLTLAPWRLLGYNLFCHHMVYNATALQEVMPSDSVYVTILRNPMQLFESYYEYSNLREQLGITLEEFASLTTKVGAVEDLCKRRRVPVPKNLMLSDFGMSPKNSQNDKEVQKMIDHINKKFDLVMISERFDQSMVLLKNLLCWDTADVVGFTVNARSTTYKKNLTEKATRNLEIWNKGDLKLYQHFEKKFQASVSVLGKLKMQLQTIELQEERNSLFNSCIDRVVPSEKLTQFKFWTTKVMGYVLKVKSAICENLVKPERELTDSLRMKQLWLSLPDNVAEKLRKLSKMPSFSLNESVLKSVNKVLNKSFKTTHNNV